MGVVLRVVVLILLWVEEEEVEEVEVLALQVEEGLWLLH